MSTAIGVITGASGLLGRAILEKFQSDKAFDVEGLAFSRAREGSGLIKLDLTAQADVEAYLSARQPDFIIHCAAERRPDVVEKDPEGSEAINVTVPTHLAQWSALQEKVPLLINISTDYVFDGSKPPYGVDDEPNPLNAYGVSKLRGERAVRDHGKQGKAINLRVPVLYGRVETPDESAVNVLTTTIRRPSTPPAQLKKMDAFAVRYPTYVGDIARALHDLVELHNKESAGPKELPPTLHFSAMEAMTKYDMCNLMARVWNSAYAQVATEEEQEKQFDGRGIATAEYLDPEYEVDPAAATSRPRHCKLDLTEIKQLGISTECVSFEEWWKQYLLETTTTQLEAEREAAAEEAERLRLAAIAAEEKRIREEAEAEERRKKEAAEAEERRKQEEAEAEERRKKEEAEAEERRQKEEAAAEELKRKQEEDEQRVRAEEELQRKQEAEAEERKKREESEATPAAAATETKAEESSSAVRGEVSDKADAVSADGAAAIEESSATETLQGVSAAEPSDEAETAEKKEGDDAPAERLADPSPSSPNPSFNSLRASPTPPASSPEPKDPSFTLPAASLQDAGEAMRRGSTQSSIAPVESAVAPLGEGTTGTPRTASTPADKVKEDAGTLPSALLKGDDSLIGTQDADSDGYGEPSPRISAHHEFASPQPSSAAPGPASSGDGAAAGNYGSMVRSTINAVDRHIRDANMRDDVPASQQQRKFAFEVKVGDPQKVGDPMTAHTVYTVRTKTDCQAFRALQFSVLRRYSDFRWLHAALVHNNPGVIVPPVPEKVKIGRFAPELVESRRHGLEVCVNKIANHPVLQNDDDLKLFLESDNFAHDVKMRDLRKGPVPTPEARTYFGWSNNLSGPKFVENDEWFDRQRGYLDSLESQLKQIVKAINALAQHRKDFSMQTADFSTSMMVLSTSSLSRAMSTCFAGLGEVQRRAHEIADVQSDADVREIGTVIYEYERIVGSVRKAFMTRTDAWQAWQRAEDDLVKLRAKNEKLKAETGRIHPERLHLSLQDIADKESQTLHLKNMFDDISRRCKSEMAAFDVERVEDFCVAFEKWIDGMVERQEEMVREWEQYVGLLERQTGRTIDGSRPARAQ